MAERIQDKALPTPAAPFPEAPDALHERDGGIWIPLRGEKYEAARHGRSPLSIGQAVAPPGSGCSPALPPEALVAGFVLRQRSRRGPGPGGCRHDAIEVRRDHGS